MRSLCFAHRSDSLPMLLRSRNHIKSSGQSLEPIGSEIFPAQRAWDYKKDFNGFLPVGHKKDSFYSIDSCSSIFCPELPDFPDYGETHIQETMCFITWITINAHEFIINFFHIYNFWIIYGQFMEIHVQKIFVRLAYLCSEKLSLYGVELDLIYVRRWQKCPILCSKLTPHACFL